MSRSSCARREKERKLRRNWRSQDIIVVSSQAIDPPDRALQLHSQFVAAVMFGHARSVVFVARTIHHIFGVGLLREGGVGIRGFWSRSWKKTDVFIRPPVAGISHSDGEVLSAADGEKADPCLMPLIVSDQGFSGDRRFVGVSRLVRRKIVGLLEPKVAKH